MARIMVVDDEPDVVNLVDLILSSVGHEIIGAENGRAALEKLKEVRPDLILMDLMMPDLTGWETLERIRKQDGLPRSLTPETAERDDIEELVDYIEKPFTKDSLIKRVNYSIIEDLDTIADKKSRLKTVVKDDKTLATYEIAARLERLHKSILSTLKESYDKMSDPTILEAIESQKSAIEKFRSKKEAIEKQLDEKNPYFNAESPETGVL
jgi:two-component system response regulator VicR